MSTIETERATAVDPDGWEYDVETGEVLGRADVADAFAIDSPERADWALELRSKIEGDLAGVNARLKAVTAQLQALRRQHERRLAWWDWRFSQGLVAFARSVLAGRSRTVRFGWGSVSFRQTKGHSEIIDMAAAVEFVRAWWPETVRRVETVGVNTVLALAEKVRESTGEDERLPFLVTSGPGENVTIITGVEEAIG